MDKRIIILLVSLFVVGFVGKLVFDFVNKPYFFERHFKTINRVGSQTKPDYRIVFLGDSMTEYLGNFDELRSYLKDYFPNKTFLLLNYGFGSTNILSVQDRMEKESTYSGRIFQPINDIPFDLIVIESFGHNPLSAFPLPEGLKKQNEALDKIIQTISLKHPKSSIVFMVTISPNSKKYAENSVDLTPEKRIEWANERSAYIKNHIDYAKSHNIPIINVYQKSLDNNGNGDMDYINNGDFIHPSPTGLYLISETIAKFLSENHLLPN